MLRRMEPSCRRVKDTKLSCDSTPAITKASSTTTSAAATSTVKKDKTAVGFP